jgi:hypothetical protein
MSAYLANSIVLQLQLIYWRIFSLSVESIFSAWSWATFGKCPAPFLSFLTFKSFSNFGFFEYVDRNDQKMSAVAAAVDLGKKVWKKSLSEF